MNEEERKRLLDWFELRIDHLKERRARGDEDAYVRLTEVEAMKDFIFGK